MLAVDEPWNHEPDGLWFTTVYGYAALIVRHPYFKHLCGYMGVPPGHPWYGLNYDADALDCTVHGGVTYTDKEPPKYPDCPLTDAGLWWLGFDCAHCGDYMPGLNARIGPYETYRTLDYVQTQLEGLAEQADAVLPDD